MLNRSEQFKQAHKMTKAIIRQGDNYRVTFGICLKLVQKCQGTIHNESCDSFQLHWFASFVNFAIVIFLSVIFSVIGAELGSVSVGKAAGPVTLSVIGLFFSIYYAVILHKDSKND